MLSDKCELTIDENGVYGKSTSNKTIRWEIMKDAYLHKVNNQIFICLVLHEKESIYKDESDFKKDMMEFNKIFFGIQEVNLNIGLLNCDKNKILGLLLLLIHFENDKRSKVINDYLMEL